VTSLYGFLVEICKTVTLSGTIARLAPENAAARMCLEFGATVVAYVLVRDLSTFAPEHHDRRIEVIATGLPVWNGPRRPSTLPWFPSKEETPWPAASIEAGNRWSRASHSFVKLLAGHKTSTASLPSEHLPSRGGFPAGRP